MSSPSEMLRGLVRALFAEDSGRGRCVMFMSACRGEGVSTLVRSVGEAAAARAQRGCAILDLDVLRDTHHAAFVAQARRGGPGLGAGVSAAFGGKCFFEPNEAAAHYMVHRIGSSRLMVGHLHTSRMRPGVAVRIVDQPAYWNGARAALDLTLVDAPALARARVGLVAAASMDAVVIVAAGEGGSATATLDLKAELQARGAPLLGVVYTKADPTALAIERVLAES